MLMQLVLALTNFLNRYLLLSLIVKILALSLFLHVIDKHVPFSYFLNCLIEFIMLDVLNLLYLFCISWLLLSVINKNVTLYLSYSYLLQNIIYIFYRLLYLLYCIVYYFITMLILLYCIIFNYYYFDPLCHLIIYLKTFLIMSPQNFILLLHCCVAHVVFFSLISCLVVFCTNRIITLFYNLNWRHVTILIMYLIHCAYIQILHAFVLQFVKQKNLMLGFLNPGSLGTCHEEFVVAMQRYEADIVGINETWLRAGEEARAPALPGYRLRHIPRPPGVRSRGGGVGFYLKCGIHARLLKHPPSAVEQMWLSVNLNGLKLAIGTAYRPPWLDVDIFMDALTESVGALSRHDHIVLMGDFNIDLLKPNEPNFKKLNEFLECMSLKQYIDEPTHFTDHSETLLDLVCSSTKVTNVAVDYIRDLSGHAFITFELNIKKPKPAPRWLSYRPLANINYDQFSNDISNIVWESVLSNNVNDSLEAFNALLIKVFDRHAPIKTSLAKEQSHPWITDTIKVMIKLRDNAYAKSRRTKLDCHKEYYKELKKMVTTAIYREKTAFFEQSINKNIKDPRTLWKNLKRNVVDFNMKLTELPDNICDPDHINAHFLNVPGNNFVSISQLTSYCFDRFSHTQFNLEPVDEKTVFKIIRNITTNASGVDGISLNMLMLTLPQTLGVITAIINMSIRTSTVPSIWKESIIKPIPKVNHPTGLKDLRPISILPLMSKILEKVVCIQMTEYLYSNSILPRKQSGFRKGRSTATALLDVIDDLLAGRDVGEGAILVLLDYSRAFDTINISLLLAKLTYYGFDHSTVKWFCSYLTNRSQRVEVTLPDGKKIYSSKSLITQGVPQGSILGPILFILYTADLPNHILDCEYHMYADDLQIYRTINPRESLVSINQINSDLERIAAWSELNCLVLNSAKTKYIVVGSKIQIQNIESCTPKIKIKNETIEQVFEARNLGLLIDGQFKFESHVINTVKQCYFRLKVLYKIRQFLSAELRVRLCESLILSKLNFLDTVISGCLLSRTKKLIQRVQNSCARFSFPIPARAHVTPYLNSASMLNMESRRDLHIATLLFGIIKTQSHSYLFSKLRFTQRESQITDRLICPSFKTAAFRGSFKYLATKCWNNIPPPIRHSLSVYSFKIKYKNYLMLKQKNMCHK